MSSTASLKASGATAGHVLTICIRRSIAVLPVYTPRNAFTRELLRMCGLRGEVVGHA